MGWFWNSSTDASSAKPPASSLPPPHPPVSQSAAECPVDPQTRQAWLDAAKSQNQAAKPQRPSPAPSIPQGDGCDSRNIDQPLPPRPSILTPSTLSHHRAVSSIPRAAQGQENNNSSSSTANSETNAETSPSGHWIYPSESMFFAAMARKNHRPQAADMATVVPIHNAVNERAWSEILKWEEPYDSSSCGGPRLVSFRGDSSKLTPRARWNTLLGYQAPFDRHDWLVDRCGVRVEYVIDFYQGKEREDGRGVSFYLDVRPKVNSWEGVRMRARRVVGL